jgi:hypothetical protein
MTGTSRNKRDSENAGHAVPVFGSLGFRGMLGMRYSVVLHMMIWQPPQCKKVFSTEKIARRLSVVRCRGYTVMVKKTERSEVQGLRLSVVRCRGCRRLSVVRCRGCTVLVCTHTQACR